MKNKKRWRPFSKHAKIKVLKKTRNKCCYCGNPLFVTNVTMEHIWDRSLLKNYISRSIKCLSRKQEYVLPCCRKCNTSRSDKYSALEFAQLNNSPFINLVENILKLPIPQYG